MNFLKRNCENHRIFSPLVPLELSAAGFFKYLSRFSGHQALKVQKLWKLKYVIFPFIGRRSLIAIYRMWR